MRSEYLLTLITAVMALGAWQLVKHEEYVAVAPPIEVINVWHDHNEQSPKRIVVEKNVTNPSTPPSKVTPIAPVLQQSLPAFPEAQGGGAGAKGGRGGQVYVVTNLHDRGKGSLRYGLEQLTGSRTIVFRVGGYIHLSYPIVVDHDGFITIAGQTAPGDGITLTTVNSREPVLIFRHAHDVIVRYLRIRKGGTKAHGQHGSGLVISRGGSDIIVDHCSVSWTADDNINIWANASGKEGLKNITIQNSISAEGLNYGHPGTSLLVGGSAYVEQMTNISVHHNFFANNKNRNPLLKVASGDIINNIIYNWSWWATGIGGGITADIIGNRYQAGPNTKRKGRGEVVYKAYDPMAKTPAATGVKGSCSLYFEGNIGPHNPDSGRDAWDVMIEKSNRFWSYPIINGKPTKQRLSQQYRRKEKRQQPYPIEIDSADLLEQKLLAKGGVGASQRLSAEGKWVENRDVVDQRIINAYFERRGKLVQTVDDVGGWTVYDKGLYRYVPEKKFIRHLKKYRLNGGHPYRDSDADGMPDIWEQQHHLNPKDATDAIQDRDGDGYENLEEFLNGTAP